MIPFVPHPESISPDLLHSRMQGIELWKHHKSPQASYAGFFLGGGSSLGPCILIQNPGSRESMRFQQKSHNFGSSCWSQMLISHVWNITRIQLQSWGEFLPGFTISTLQIGLQSNPYSRVEGSKSWRKKRAESKVPAFFIFPSIFCPFRFLSVTLLPADSSLPSPGELPRARVLPGHCPWQVVARSCSRCTCPDRFTSPLEQSLEFCASILVSPEQKVQGTVPNCDGLLVSASASGKLGLFKHCC